MRRIITPLLTLFTLFFVFNTAQAQLFEDFESGNKGGYSGASVTLSTGDWFLDDALIGNLANDKYNGSQGVRMDRRDGSTGNIYMQFDYPNGADDVSFYLAHYGDFAEEAALQVQYSTDGGSTWTDVGDEIQAPADLTQYTIPVQISGNIRFKFIQSSGTDRMNIDDIRITDYIMPEENATIAVSVDGQQASNLDSVYFASTLIGTEREKTIEIKNLGEEVLELSEVNLTGSGYTVTGLADSSLAFNETTELFLTFSPETEDEFFAEFEILSNSENTSTFTLFIRGKSFADGDVMPIAEARELPFGTRVSVGGRVTVANEFGGPAHIQDHTAGIAVYWPDFHAEVELGDSVVVSGPLTEFNPIDGEEGDFLTQIAEYEGDDNITYEVIDTERKEVTPEIITLQEMNSGGYEAQLVVIQNVTIDHSGAFQGENNYDITDASGSGLLRIDGDANVAGSTAPDGQVNIVGVVDQFNGDYQLKPRSTDDLGVEEISYPGEDISKDLTFEVVTWNIEWFGSGSNGPDDIDQQLSNVIRVVEEIDAEIYALQEIANPGLFYALIDSLEDYGGFMSSFIQTQKTAYLFKRSEIDSLDSGNISDGMTYNQWAGGRFPLMFQFNATINEETQEVYAFNIHAKAFDDEDSYQQRLNASAELKQYLDATHPDDNVIFLGDYNDKVIGSITTGKESPYQNFVDDQEYTVITKTLEEQGFSSQTSGSIIDNITITSELEDEYFEGTERVENTNYIGSYLSSTSDHYPIWTRFQFGDTVINSIESPEQPTEFALNQNYPNPFNPSTVISYQLTKSSEVSLKVYDMLGREVATLVNGDRQVSGSHEVTFDASNLSSGMYIYRLSTANGQQLTRKMMLIK